MPNGLAIPVGVDSSGSSRVVSSDENDSKIIRTALSDCDNLNAFQQALGLGSAMIFDINDPLSRARVMTRLVGIFREFEKKKRYKMKSDSVKWYRENEEMVLEFKYINLESDEEETFRRTFA